MKKPAHLSNNRLIGVAYGMMIVSSMFLLSSLDAGVQGDTRLYQAMANDVFNGALPYRDHVFEYPPYAIPIFLAPRIFGEASFAGGFIGMTLITDWMLKLELFSIGFRQSKTGRALLPLLFYCASVPFTRYFFLQRYDIYPALICVTAVWLLSAGRFLLCGVAVAVGIGVKLYPAVFVPPLFVLAARQGKWKPFAGGLALGLAPIALLGFFLPWWRFAEFQAARGLQAESLYSSVLWLGHRLGLAHVDWQYTKKWYEVTGPTAAAVVPWARALFVLAVAVSTVVAWRAAAQIERPSLAGIARLLLVPLLGFVVFNQVFSPQFMVWLLPFAALASLEGNIWPPLFIAIATVLTPIIYPSLSGHYFHGGLDLLEAMVLFSRNAVLMTAWVLLSREAIMETRARESGSPNTDVFGRILQRFHQSTPTNDPFCGESAKGYSL